MLLRPPLRPLLRPVLRSPLERGGGFHPNILFASGETGDWWDPSDLPLMYQDSAGTTAAAVNQPVGLMLGQRFKGQRGAEQRATGAPTIFGTATAATYDTGTGVGAATRVDASNRSIVRFSGLGSHRTYEVSISCTGGQPTNVRDGAATVIKVVAVGETTTAFVPTLSNGVVDFDSSAAGATEFIVNSIREVPGIHRYQTTAPNRPTLSARYNQLIATEDFGGASWTKNFTASVTGTNTINLPAENDYVSQSYTVSIAAGHKWTGSMVLSGSGTCRLRIARAGVGTFEEANTTVTLTDTPTRYVVEITFANAQTGVRLDVVRVVGNTATQVTANKADLRLSIHANQPGIPSYQRVNTATDYDTVGFPTYLSYNGTNSWMQTSAVDFSGTDKMTVVGAWTKLSDAAAGMIVEASANSGGADGTFFLVAPASAGNGNYSSRSRGTVTVDALTAAVFAAPISNVLAISASISGDMNVLRVNGAQAASNSLDQGPGNYGNHVIYWGARAGTSVFFNGNEYISAVCGASKTETLIARMERYAAAKAGITL